MTVERQIHDEPTPFIKMTACGVATVCPLCEQPLLPRRGSDFASCCGHQWARTTAFKDRRWVLVDRWVPNRLRLLMS